VTRKTQISLYFKRIPNIIKPLAKNLVFEFPNDENEIYLTFDDGPHPELTPWVLDVLKSHEAKATFFLIGSNIKGNEQIVERTLSEGHHIGIHGYNHLSGWKTKDVEYIADMKKAAEQIESKLCRPPYGEITRSQAKDLSKQFKLIMWSHLSADFDLSLSPQDCINHATDKIKSGSIIVFHDSEKAKPRLLGALEPSIKYYLEQGFNLMPIPA
jgi:peptidoglycan/xylan/chitin deacetylase (PgdA/CDA1 family)